MAISGAFAGGLAQGFGNGLQMYEAFMKAKTKKEIRDAMKSDSRAADPAIPSMSVDPVGLQDSGAQAFAVKPPMMGTQASGEIVGQPAQPLVQSPIMTQPVDTQGNPLGAAEAYPVGNAGQSSGPGIQTALQQDQLAEQLGTVKKKDAPLNESQVAQSAGNSLPQSSDGYLGGGEFGQMADSLNRGLYKALELGAIDEALNLLVVREKTIGQYRDQALGEAMSRFDLTGDPNAFVPFVNRFMPTSIRFDKVETGGQTADGQPVYVARGVNTETGKPFEHVLSRDTFMRYVSAAGDGAAYRKMFVDQAQYLHDMQKFKEQERFKTDERVREKTTLDEKGIDASDKEPAIVKTANWLIRTGAAKSSADAYRMARNLGGKNREDYALEYAKIRMKGQESPFGVPDKDAITLTEALNEGRAAYDQNVGGGGDGSGSTPGQAASPGGKLPDAKPGMVLNGYRFKGGDENKSENWEKI
ncbi:hypothetical protein [Castellaniella sp.]|uniref:hypothetical protein n=1 Tax=Castellaniella sp. TaxID=1955812 RepID=UPI00355F917C